MEKKKRGTHKPRWRSAGRRGAAIATVGSTPGWRGVPGGGTGWGGAPYRAPPAGRGPSGSRPAVAPSGWPSSGEGRRGRSPGQGRPGPRPGPPRGAAHPPRSRRRRARRRTPRSRVRGGRGRGGIGRETPGGSNRGARSGAPRESRRGPRGSEGCARREPRSPRSAASGRRRSRLRLVALLLPRGGHLFEAARLLERGLLVLLANRPVDLFAVDAHVRRGLDPEPDLIPLHLEDPHGDVVTYADHLPQPPCQDQHGSGTLPVPSCSFGQIAAGLEAGRVSESQQVDEARAGDLGACRERRLERRLGLREP